MSHTSLMSHPLSTSNVTYQFHLTFPFSTEDEFAPPPIKMFILKCLPHAMKQIRKCHTCQRVKDWSDHWQTLHNLGTHCQSKVIQFGQNCFPIKVPKSSKLTRIMQESLHFLAKLCYSIFQRHFALYSPCRRRR